jgi:predicted Fe-Mo cluster-binding NifX family protein
MSKVAIPSMSINGLDSEVCAHFGSCNFFTLVELSEDAITKVTAIPNVSHENGHNCSAPAELLSKNDVDIVLVSGIGGRPLISLEGKGIKVYSGAFGSVDDAVSDYLDGMLEELKGRGTCNCSHD